MTEQSEREVDEMQERSGRLEDEIADTREDWKRKKADSSVPGATDDHDGSADQNEAE